MRSETDGRYDLDRRSMRTTAVIELRKVGPEECVAKRPTVEARVELREPGSVAVPGGRTSAVATGSNAQVGRAAPAVSIAGPRPASGVRST